MYICTSISRAQSEYTKWRKMHRYMLLNEPSSLRGKEDTGVTLLTGCGINLWLQPHVSSPVHIEEMPSVRKWDDSVFHTHADIDILAQSLSCWHRQAFARFGQVRECCLNSLLSYWLGRSAVLWRAGVRLAPDILFLLLTDVQSQGDKAEACRLYWGSNLHILC